MADFIWNTTWKFKVWIAFLLSTSYVFLYKNVFSQNEYKKIDTYIVSLVSHRRLLHYLCSVFSFQFTSNLVPKKCIYDDGTLTSFDKKILIYFFPELKIVSQSSILKKWKKYKYSSTKKFRFNENITPVRKKIDIFLFPVKNQVLYFDTDVLFISEPLELIEHISSKKTRKQSLYSARVFKGNDLEQTIRELLKSKFKLIHNSTFNSGLLFLSKALSPYKLEQAISFLNKVHYSESSWLAEETAVYLAFDKKATLLTAKKHINVSSYAEYFRDLSRETVSIHYSSDQGLKERMIFDFMKKFIFHKEIFHEKNK